MSEKKDNVFVRLGKTLWRWCKRMFLGASKELSDEELIYLTIHLKRINLGSE